MGVFCRFFLLARRSRLFRPRHRDVLQHRHRRDQPVVVLAGIRRHAEGFDEIVHRAGHRTAGDDRRFPAAAKVRRLW